MLMMLHTTSLKQKISLFFILGVIGGLLCGAPTVTQAQATTSTTSSTYPVEQLPDDGHVYGDFVMGPGKVEVSLKPGETRTVELTVTNRMGQPEQFRVEVEDTAAGRTSKQPIVLLGNDRGPYTLKDYIHIPKKTFTLQNMQRARIPVTISLPPDAEPGGRYGSVLVSIVSREADVNPANGAAPSSAIISRIGTLFFVTTPGDVNTSGQLKSLTTIPNRKIFSSGPINFGLLFENTGDVHLDPYGEIDITNMFGQQVGQITLDPWFVLPRSSRTREILWDHQWLVGRYSATAKINRGYGNQVDELTFSFWVIPWKLLLAVFGVLVIFYLVIKLFFSRFEFKRK